jgi:peptidoglycan/xylan/chitin deacetylase (PgdA/CDA1 family)
MKLRKLASFLDKSHLRPLLAACMPARGIVGLNYHRIGDGSRSELDRGLWSASEEGFDQQLAWLKLNSDVISPAEIDLARRDSSGRHVLITFDDGYKDNYDCAVPTLRRHGLTATFFIATGFIDDPRLAWWDEIASQIRRTDRDEIDLPQWLPQPQRLVVGQREAVIRTMLRKFKSLPGDQAKRFLADLRDATQASPPSLHHEDLWMSWDMLREMDAAGMTIGGHTTILSYPDPRPRNNGQRYGLRRASRRDQQRIDYFSYPVGNRIVQSDSISACGFRRRLRVPTMAVSPASMPIATTCRVAIEATSIEAGFAPSSTAAPVRPPTGRYCLADPQYVTTCQTAPVGLGKIWSLREAEFNQR